MVRMTDNFYFRGHLCIVTELLSFNLYELIKANQFAGFSTVLIRRFTAQMLASLQLMRSHRIVHCDLKPEVGSCVAAYPVADGPEHSIVSSGEERNQDHRFREQLSRDGEGFVHRSSSSTANLPSVYIHPVPLLPKSGGDLRYKLRYGHRHVESRVGTSPYLRDMLTR